MSKKIDRAVHGPGVGEIILGVVLSLALGAVLGAVVLMIRPVQAVKEMPKEEDRVSGAVYYIEGSKMTSRAGQAAAKRKAFTAGQSVTATEDEINSLITVSKPPAPNAPKDAKQGAEAPAGGETIAVGTPNVRISDGKVQVAAPVTLNVFGFSQKMVVQARGEFVKGGEGFVYEPSELYVGSCPVERVPVLSGYVRKKVLAAQPIPEEIATAWKLVSDITVEGNALRVSMQ
ncbi:MAG: hypothetical protein WD941_08325 [Opitutus sp.]